MQSTQHFVLSEAHFAQMFPKTGFAKRPMKQRYLFSFARVGPMAFASEEAKHELCLLVRVWKFPQKQQRQVGRPKRQDPFAQTVARALSDNNFDLGMLPHFPNAPGEVKFVEALEPQQKRHKTKAALQDVHDVFLSRAQQQSFDISGP
eukprot:3962971-Amphidinium_carterae.1